jgi:glucan 1,3-beta-glucosidase
LCDFRCDKLGKDECLKRLTKHWNTWLTEEDIKFLSENGINHVRIPVGYWIMGDIRAGEPWVLGDLHYLERGISWCAKYGIHVILDLHCAPGSQNGFDNSGKKGEIHFNDAVTMPNGRVIYPNINRALQAIDAITHHFSQKQFVGTVVAVELANEIFITVPLEIVKDYYLQGYEIVKKYGELAVIIGDSFRFDASDWGDFMFPPHYRHVWIDTHIYQVFDSYKLSFSWQQHIDETCKKNLPQVAIAPLSTLVGEWSLATTDCAQWLNGFGSGSRFDGTFPGTYKIGECSGEGDYKQFSPEYKKFLLEFAEKQMDAYESGSSAGWFFWNFKTEKSPQWNYILGLKEGWIPKNGDKRQFHC